MAQKTPQLTQTQLRITRENLCINIIIIIIIIILLLLLFYHYCTMSLHNMCPL